MALQWKVLITLALLLLGGFTIPIMPTPPPPAAAPKAGIDPDRRPPRRQPLLPWLWRRPRGEELAP